MQAAYSRHQLSPPIAAVDSVLAAGGFPGTSEPGCSRERGTANGSTDKSVPRFTIGDVGDLEGVWFRHHSSTGSVLLTGPLTKSSTGDQVKGRNSNSLRLDRAKRVMGADIDGRGRSGKLTSHYAHSILANLANLRLSINRRRHWLWLSGLSIAMHANSATPDIRFSRTIRDLVLLRALPALLLVGLLITALIE